MTGLVVGWVGRRLRREVRRREASALTTPRLPPATAKGVWIDCLVQYTTQFGDSHQGRSLAQFSNRLNVSGDEALLYLSDDPTELVLMAAFPEAIPAGRKRGGVSPLIPPAMAAASALLWAAVLWLLLENALALRGLLTG